MYLIHKAGLRIQRTHMQHRWEHANTPAWQQHSRRRAKQALHVCKQPAHLLTISSRTAAACPSMRPTQSPSSLLVVLPAAMLPVSKAAHD